jgi:uncharacterized membrane protein YhaH (DUF805 family)
VNGFLKSFSFQGRANRQPYWVTNFILACALTVGLFALGGLSAGMPLLSVLFLPIVVGYFWAGLAVGARRLHDRNKSAWWLLLFWGVPILVGVIEAIVESGGGSAGETAGVALKLLNLPIVIWVFIELGCLRGTVGSNRFGEDPLGTTAEVFA